MLDMNEHLASPAVFRIIDANYNRCLEGLRVLEDHARFEREDVRLATDLKNLRHEIATSLPDPILGRMHSMRDSQGDIGRGIEAEDEYSRPDTISLIRANASRVKQALRTLEEYSKTLAGSIAHRFETARYRFYSLEMLLDRHAARREQLHRASLYVLVDGGTDAENFLKRMNPIVAACPDVIQLRDKRLDDRTLLARARLLVPLARANGVLVVINDRPDLCLLADADGVHVGQDELSVADARRIVGPDRIIGVSTHAIEQARQAVAEGADYLGAGPTFPSGTKKFEHFPGVDYLKEVASEIVVPAFAIGGIDADRLPIVLESGIQRIAVSGCVAVAEQPAAVITQLRTLLPKLAP